MPEPLSHRIQKPATRRLHYDFRLELGGVLRSWAVARGPSLVPGKRRLTVEVEDHGLDYADFKGLTAPGHYGAGVVRLWDRGTWEQDADSAAAFASGSLAFSLHGETLTERWRLTRMKPRPRGRHVSWLLMKSYDEAAREAGEPDILEAQVRSVLTGCTVENITASAA